MYNKVYDLPSLIPMPQKMEWGKEKFALKNYTTIVISNKACSKVAISLQQYLATKNIRLSIKTKSLPGERSIELLMKEDQVPGRGKEAYHLSVSQRKIQFSATTENGLFNAIQTFKQLTESNQICSCEIADWPAFSWRGFMVDVGRNYQSIKQLKQQIDVMAAYKLNIFHLHLTEDIAWRLQSKKYPQLTAAKYMLRNPGKYYSLPGLRDLIKYCKAKYITFIPEIDMPGHSAAFKRAMGFGMQTEEGIVACKNILAELCRELDLTYVHIGGDEVKITTKEFLPEMATLLQLAGKKVIEWNPGGNRLKGTLLQMWNGSTKPASDNPAIDSRHLYLNHFDPLESVVSIFNHSICDTVSGDENKLGATLCNWPDRKIEKEEDAITMNALYPAMLAFAERCWQGGGWKNYLSDFGDPGTMRYNAFVEFENRLLPHKKQYFKQLPFSYARQADIEWKLVGPYKNNGNTNAEFLPEESAFMDTVQLDHATPLFGGTIVLRHFWYPMIRAHLQDPEDSSTCYAIRKIWTDEDEEKNCWIGFNNLSRSHAADSPPEGAWDNKGSAVWVNGKLIAPPHWKHAGQKGNAEIPLSDEGYEYRAPTRIFFKKGWNTVLIKAPVGSFKTNDWQNPVKWMFTFVVL
jgi:hypothetical protein